jgi:asparagine synthase (glutamine-hydrolysing)
MCGIAGVLDARAGTSAERLAGLASEMTGTLVHRGPDDDGMWVDAEGGVALGHRRLAVIDPGPGGAQPMSSIDGRWVITYNGEIYNHRSLRRRLQQHRIELRSDSDTEVLLEAVALWGIERALDACEGMFAVALWDRRSRALHLVRDRFGEKPLYFARASGFFVFASELKAFRALPDFTPEIDRAAVAEHLRSSCIAAPRTIWRNAWKMMPGHVLTCQGRTLDLETPEQYPYWSMAETVSAARRRPLALPVDEMTDRLDHVLSESVASRMVADVPVGAFLSGGIDSSTIVALMQRHAPGAVKTFTVGFGDAAFDESADAQRVAQYLGTDHTSVQVGDGDAQRAIEMLPDIWDEPFSDVSQIPTYLVSCVARQGVTVSLSGDGGDELFAGYNRHAWLERLRRSTAVLPPKLRRAVGAAIGGIPPGVVERAAGATKILPQNLQLRNPSTKVVKAGRVLAAPTAKEAYRSLTTHWVDAASIVLGLSENDDQGAFESMPFGQSSITEEMLWLDLIGYLPNDILVKLDRAAMAVSLETRVPFLDRQVLELAWRLPLQIKLRDGKTKWPLRQVLQRHVPADLVDRPKMGFGFPIGRLLRGPLREWADHLMADGRLRAQGLLDPAPIRRAWAAHCTGRQELGYELWDVLVLQAWIDRWHPSLG